MSFKKVDLFPCNPATTRGESTRISSSKDKIVYTNGRTVIVRCPPLRAVDRRVLMSCASRFVI